MDSREFWKDIIYKDGKLDERQVLKELDDFFFIMEEVSKVYMEITDGQLSKPNHYAKTVLALFEEKFLDKEIMQDDIADILASDLTKSEKLHEIKTYLGISLRRKGLR